MASIPCAAYQVTYIHDNLRRKNAASADGNHPHSSCHSQMRAAGQLFGSTTGADGLDKTSFNNWFNPKTWSMPWLHSPSQSVQTSPMTSK